MLPVFSECYCGHLRGLNLAEFADYSALRSYIGNDEVRRSTGACDWFVSREEELPAVADLQLAKPPR